MTEEGEWLDQGRPHFVTGGATVRSRRRGPEQEQTDGALGDPPHRRKKNGSWDM